MNEPPTLMLWDGDDERTLVDGTQLSGPEQAFAGSGHRASLQPQKDNGEGSVHAMPRTPRAWRALLSNHRREIVELSVALTLFAGLGSVMHQQRRVAENVRETLADIRAASRDMATVRSKSLPATRVAYNGGDVERRASSKELARDELEALEQQAAALIASNDLPAALSRYETLAELFPDDRTLRDVITVLRGKLRCDPSAGFGGVACR